jgi:2,3-bisphosphoglycerate-dependent phosphoglycerate mutase
MKRSIYLFRHGMSTFNKEHKFTGWIDAKLSKEGIDNAKKIALKLKDKKIDIAYHSSLSRSIDTLNHVLKYHPECTRIINDDRIIERNYGDYSGGSKSVDTFKKKSAKKQYELLVSKHMIPKLKGFELDEYLTRLAEAELRIIRRSYYVAPKNGESVDDVEKRVLPFIKDILTIMEDLKVNIAISAHGNSMRPILKYFKKMTPEEIMKVEFPFDDYYEFKVDV